MILTFVEKNRKLLRTYYFASLIIGWVLVILSAMPALLIPYIASDVFNDYPGGVARIFNAMAEVFFGRLPLGIIVLGTAQLIRYVSEKEYRPGWLLRHGSGIMYLFAALIIIGTVIRCYYIYHSTKPVDILYIEANLLLPNVTVMLILIGLGNVLKKILPIIEESRTLV